MSAPTPRVPARTVIRDAATSLFSDSGYAGTTMRDIAKVVGILPGSLYAHIESKEQLLLEIVESGIDQFLSVVSSVLDDEGGSERQLRLAITRHVQVIAEGQQRTLVVFHQWRYLSPENRQRIVAKRQRYEQIFATIIDRGMADGTFDPELDPRIAVLTVLGTLNWAAEWLSGDGSAATDDVGEKMGEILIRGLRARA